LYAIATIINLSTSLVANAFASSPKKSEIKNTTRVDYLLPVSNC